MGTKISEQIKQSEASTLRRLIDVNKVTRGITSDAEFAKVTKIPGGKSMVSQHTKAQRPISLECAVAYAIGLAKPLEEISPRLSAMIDSLPSVPPSLKAGELEKSGYSSNVTPLPTPNRPMLSELASIAARISDRGLAQLIERAIALAEQHPLPKPNHAN